MDPKQLRESALYYHRHPKPGKIAVTPIKQLTNQYDLSMAYSPGVAFACEEIVADHPAGRPGMPIGVHSGERVNIAPAGKGAAAGNTYIMNVNSTMGPGQLANEFNILSSVTG